MPISYFCYVLPKKMLDAKEDEIGVVGGTFIKNADEKNPHPEEFERVRQNMRIYCGLNKKK